jgi:hypothetical protein
MIIIAGIAIWLILVLFVVVLCRGAASGDGRDATSTEHYPVSATAQPRTDVAGLVLLEDEQASAPATAPEPTASRPKDHAGRERAGQYAAGS